MSYIQEVTKKVEKIQNTEFGKLVVWSDRCATEFKSFILYIISRIVLLQIPNSLGDKFSH